MELRNLDAEAVHATLPGHALVNLCTEGGECQHQVVRSYLVAERAALLSCPVRSRKSVDGSSWMDGRTTWPPVQQTLNSGLQRDPLIVSSIQCNTRQWRHSVLIVPALCTVMRLVSYVLGEDAAKRRLVGLAVV